MNTSIKSKGRGRSKLAAAGLALAIGGATFGAMPAFAAGGTCSAYQYKQVLNNQPDEYGVRAKCTSLNIDSKAKGTLDRFGIDSNTAWFTRLNTTYSSGHRPGTGTARTTIAAV